MTNRNVVSWLLNPFQFIAGIQALGWGLVVLALGAALGALNGGRFDGVLDFHVSNQPIPLKTGLEDAAINWLSLSFCLLTAGKFFSKTKFRLIDLLGTQALARWPSLIETGAAFLPGFQRFSRYLLWTVVKRDGVEPKFQLSDALIFSCAIILMVLAMIWMVMLMYRAFSVSCNLKGGKAVGVFVCGLIAAEILSKILLFFL